MASQAAPRPGNVTPVAAPASTLSIVSLVSGILAWCALPIIGSIVAIITGHMAKGEIKRGQGKFGGNGLATGGLVLGYASLVLGCVGILSFAASASMLAKTAADIQSRDLNNKNLDKPLPDETDSPTDNPATDPTPTK